MRTVSYKEFLGFEPCWLETEDGKKKLEKIGRRKERWTALDVLDLPEKEVSAIDKLWAVMREEFIEAEILHEFACRCAEQALALAGNHDPRSVAAIEAKRRWLRGEIGDDELRKARAAARDAARDAAWDDARNAAWNATMDAAWDAAWDAALVAARNAAWDAARAARDATGAAARDAALVAARNAALVAARNAQASMLRELLEERG